MLLAKKFTGKHSFFIPVGASVVFNKNSNDSTANTYSEYFLSSNTVLTYQTGPQPTAGAIAGSTRCAGPATFAHFVAADGGARDYNFASNTAAAQGGNVSACLIGTACGNKDYGVYQNESGGAQTALSKVNWAPLTTAAGALFDDTYGSFAAGNQDVAIFAMGSTSVNGDSTATKKYTYADELVVDGTALTIASSNGAAIGIATYGIFNCSNANSGRTLTNKYVYSSGANNASTNLTTFGYRNAGGGNDDTGIFTANGSNTVLWTYAGDSVANGTQMTQVMEYAAAGSNGITGVNM